MTDAVAAAPAEKAPKKKRTRAEYVMYGLGFASGLPYSLLAGSLGVWIANSGLSFSVIGALSWIGLFYAFKFIWAPAFDWLVPPWARTMGRRRAWMVVCQVLIAVCLFGMAFIDPRENIVLFALFAVSAAFASASQDIVIDAWRIEQAETPKMLDSMSVNYQMGYRLAALLAGGIALLMADVWSADRARERAPTEPGVITGQFGTLNLEPDGDFQYVADPANATVVALQPGQPAVREHFDIPYTERGQAMAEPMPLDIAIRASATGLVAESTRPGPKSQGATLTGDALLDLANGWSQIWVWLAALMAVCIAATFAAPEGVLKPREAGPEQDAETKKLRQRSAVPVALGWAGSGLALLGFMFYTLGNPTASAAAFRDAATPWILLLTIGAPLAVSFWLATKPGVIAAPMRPRSFTDALFERVLAPMADLVRRYWLWALPILLLAMTYRIADSIWGSFAQPFYIAILGNSNSDVAVAQKLIGVAMTMGGIALGGVGVALAGRVWALIIGAVLAAVTNLLYVDLAYGAAWSDEFLRVTGIGGFLDWSIGGLVNSVNSTGAPIFADVNPGDKINRLTVVIAMENLAGGFASAVHLVWLSSIVNKRYAAVQYALFGSLALLIGVIFRPRLGEYVDAVKTLGLEAQAARFADIFNLAMWIGFAAVALCFVELYRQRKEKAAAVPAPDAQPKPAE
jgi:VCBS repeat-containing protein